MADKNELEWWCFLIGKVSEGELSEENKLKLEQERAVRDARNIVGDIPLRDIEMTTSLFFDSDTELITLVQAAKEFPVAQSTMSGAARDGRLKAQKLGGAWVTTRANIEEAIKAGTLRPRS